jgi:hypothetical protein
MENKLTWEEIEKQYDRQWVELVDYDWPDGTPYPQSGVVRAHAPQRKQFYQLCKEHDTREGVSPADAAIVFVGRISPPNGPYLSTSLVRMVSCD